MSKILIVTDAWHPQTNGVVRCLDTLGQQLSLEGHEVRYLTPEGFRTVPLPTYREIRLSLASPASIAARLREEQPDHIHIATEGPLGLIARHCCRVAGWRFTTSYHTRFPEYVAARLPVPEDWVYAFLRRFHGAASGTLVPTRSMQAELETHGFTNLRLWTRGVDADLFQPGPKTAFAGLPGPHLLYVGRVAVEKNIGAFLALDLPGTKIVVGDGPALPALRNAHPQVVFMGRKVGAELSALYRSADVFVFPSRTDTFGNVMIEALSSGVPVAAYPVTGPVDVLTDPACGALDDDLEAAVKRALGLSREAARAHAARFTWRECARLFSEALVPAREAMPSPAGKVQLPRPAFRRQWKYY